MTTMAVLRLERDFIDPADLTDGVSDEDERDLRRRRRVVGCCRVKVEPKAQLLLFSCSMLKLYRERERAVSWEQIAVAVDVDAQGD